MFQRTKAGELNITPKQSEAEWYRWLENIQDWCISRQLWWGHRCPAYLVRIEGQEQDVGVSQLCNDTSNTIFQANDGKNWVVGRNLQEAEERARKLAGGAKFTLEQDEDVLDTWFSSGLWPFSIMGWPDKVGFLLPVDSTPNSQFDTRPPTSKDSIHLPYWRLGGTSCSSG